MGRTPGKPCQHPGCPRTTYATHCAKHLPQFVSNGFTWDDYQAENIAERKREKYESCRVPSCSQKALRRKPLCGLHRDDRARKHCDIDFYVELMSRACEICGSTTYLHVDHDHDHHADPNEMCQDCIRGRLCRACNTAIGSLRESPLLFKRAIDYLQNRGA